MCSNTASQKNPSQGLGNPGFDLDWPGTLVYTSELALRGHTLNRFALSLRSPACRKIFLAEEKSYMQSCGLSSQEQAMVADRDWTGLLQAGGHLQAILKIAATVGQHLWHIGAHNAGTDADTLRAACPRRVSRLPPGTR
jgi:protocatechuate 4,5-dioxygenase alpha chain